jgi:putative membrane protein
MVLFAASAAQAQTTGGQGSNQATPMQQSPAGTPAGVNAAAPSDKDFVAAAAVANRFEVQEGELALSQASDAKLKEFARMMVTDHTASLKALEAAAKEAGIPVPAEPALDQAHSAKIAALKRRKGAEFDQAYRGDQMQAHQEALTLLETYQRIGAKEPLRAWAAKTLPVVKKHLEMLTSINKQ